MHRTFTPSSPSKSRSSSPIKPHPVQTQAVTGPQSNIKQAGLTENLDIIDKETKSQLDTKPAHSKPQLKTKVPSSQVKRVAGKQAPAKEIDHTHGKTLTEEKATESQNEEKNVQQSEQNTDAPDSIIKQLDLTLESDTEVSDNVDDKLETASVAVSVTTDLKTEVTDTEFADFEDIDSCIATSIGTETLKLDPDTMSPSKSPEQEHALTASSFDTDKVEDALEPEPDELESSGSLTVEGNIANVWFGLPALYNITGHLIPSFHQCVCVKQILAAGFLSIY